MTTPGPQMDMGRVVQRASDAAALHSVSPLVTQLAMTQELAEIRGTQVVELEKKLAESAAELERARQTIGLLQQQSEEERGDAGSQPEEGPGEG